MSARKLLILTGVVILLFAFIFFYERKMPTTAELAEKGEMYWDLPEDRVDKIVPPVTDVGALDQAYEPPALEDSSLRRRPLAARAGA